MANRLVILAAAVAFVQSVNGDGLLEFVDSSSGLQFPGMEGGRTEIELGDVNGDGHIDIVSIGDHGSPFVNTSEHGVMVWFGDGSGKWSLFQNGDFGYGGIALGDVDNDGIMDVAYGMHHDYSGMDFGNQILEVALGDGTGQAWTPWDDGLASNGETWGMFGTDFADVDNDGDLDVGSISFGCCAGIHVYLNNGDGTWTQSFGFLNGNSSMDFVFGDINGDGHADFAASHGNGTVWFGDGAGGFAPADGNLPSPIWRRGVSLGDVNGDGRDDLAFRNANGGLSVYSWVSPGTWVDLSGSLPTAGGFDATQIVDMNLDGHGDLVAFADGEPGLLLVYGGDGAGDWRQIASVSIPDSCGFAAMRAGVDADHNGMPDIALISEENCGIFVGGANRPRFYAEASVPSSPAVTSVRPSGGERWVAGSVRFVDWHAAVPDDDTSSMDIELSLAGETGPWIVLGADLPDNGRFQWRSPAELPSSTSCRIRYTLHVHGESVSSVTPSAFTLDGVDVDLFGDSDGDGDIDLFDFGDFVDCTTGPAGGIEPGCTVFDFDLDFDVDFHDTGLFQRAFTGPNGG